MGQRHILHCDCNCFYASVEMQEHPELRGKSIAVCGDPEARHGIVLTASYPAKRMGVKTGMPIWEAKQHCRDLIIVPANYGKYQKYSGYVREVFNDYVIFNFSIRGVVTVSHSFLKNHSVRHSQANFIQ